MITVKLENARIPKFDLTAAMVSFASEAGTSVTAALAKSAPKRTGLLARSIYVIRQVEYPLVRLTWKTKTPYTKYVIGGTGIYGPTGQPITPVRAKFLHWKDEFGGDHFARSVRGQMPNRFNRRVKKRVQPQISALFKKHIDQSRK